MFESHSTTAGETDNRDASLKKEMNEKQEAWETFWRQRQRSPRRLCLVSRSPCARVCNVCVCVLGHALGQQLQRAAHTNTSADTLRNLFVCGLRPGGRTGA